VSDPTFQLEGNFTMISSRVVIQQSACNLIHPHVRTIPFALQEIYLSNKEKKFATITWTFITAKIESLTTNQMILTEKWSKVPIQNTSYIFAPSPSSSNHWSGINDKECNQCVKWSRLTAMDCTNHTYA
jgi:hypothetical protein